MHSSQYRRVREIRPDVFLGVSPDSEDDPVLLELVPWSTDPGQAWQTIRQSDACERHDEGVICVTELAPSSGHIPTRVRGVERDEMNPARLAPEPRQRDYFGAEQASFHDVATALRTSASTGSQQPNEPTGIRQWISRRRGLALFAGGAGLIIAIALVIGLPRETSSTDTVPIPTPSTSASVDSQLESIESALGDDDPTQALELMLSASSPDPLVAELTDVLGVDGVRNIAMLERTRNGDMALVDVMGFTTGGKIARASVSMQRDATGWRLRDVQSA
jgi:hypothetical protein